MSLTIYIKGENDSNSQLPVARDVELQFLKTRLKKDDYTVKALKEIEQATYNDEYSFIDRFGFKLYSKNMSTGCKAVLCVHEFPTTVIDTIECGLNAINFIIANCTDGAILINPGSMLFYVDTSIDVIIDGRRFTDCDSLSEYISER